MRTLVIPSFVALLIHMEVQGASIDQYLPKADRFTATLYEFTDSVRADELVEKMVNARSKDDGWYDEYRRTHVGKVLPYHPRLGLTEEEYEELQDELDKRTLRPSMSVNFEVERANSEVDL